MTIKSIEPIVVNSEISTKSAIAHIQKYTTLYVDCEGKDLSRYGELYTVQIHVNDGNRRTYLLDVKSFPSVFDIAFEENTFRSLLTTKQLVMFDPRNDVDALYRLYNIMPQNVRCLQLAEAAYRRQTLFRPPKLVYGLGKCIDVYCQTSISRDEKQIKNSVSIKLKNKTFLFSDFILGNNPSREILLYSSIDVICLVELESRTWDHLNAAARNWVNIESRKRCTMAMRNVTIQDMNSRSRCEVPHFTF